MKGLQSQQLTRLNSANKMKKIDFEKHTEELRKYFESRGVDFDELLDKASVHFQDPFPRRRTEPLTQDEINALIENEKLYED